MLNIAATAANSNKITAVRRYNVRNNQSLEAAMRKLAKAIGSMLMTAGLFTGVVTMMAANV
jgi:hypothetical protein